MAGHARRRGARLARQSDRRQLLLERRELGAINIGGDGWVDVDGTRYTVRNEEAIYIGRGAQAVAFGSDLLTWRMLAGGALVLGAMYLVELAPRRSAAIAAEAGHHEV